VDITWAIRKFRFVEDTEMVAKSGIGKPFDHCSGQQVQFITHINKKAGQKPLFNLQMLNLVKTRLRCKKQLFIHFFFLFIGKWTFYPQLFYLFSKRVAVDAE